MKRTDLEPFTLHLLNDLEWDNSDLFSWLSTQFGVCYEEINNDGSGVFGRRIKTVHRFTRLVSASSSYSYTSPNFNKALQSMLWRIKNEL